MNLDTEKFSWRDVFEIAVSVEVAFFQFVAVKSAGSVDEFLLIKKRSLMMKIRGMSKCTLKICARRASRQYCSGGAPDDCEENGESHNEVAVKEGMRGIFWMWLRMRKGSSWK